MKRNVIILAALAASLLVPACLWAAAPFGSFGGKVGGGNAGAGLLSLQGWALDDDGVDSVDVLVDGIVAGRASYGRGRPGVQALHPGFPDSAAAGFAYELDTTHYLNGNHTVTARVRSRTGEFTTLNARVFQFTNVTHNLMPFGKIEFPDRSAELFGTCDLNNPARRLTVVSGYALDAGVQPTDTGVGYVELLIDRAVFANSKTDCFFSLLTGGATDCYGLQRLDIEQIFPSLPDGPHSGFRFVLDVGALISLVGYTPGSHTLTIRSGDLFEQVANIDEHQVTFSCDDDLGNQGSFGDVGVPRNGLLYGGVIQTVGWALDFEGVAAISVLVDGAFVGQATQGFARPAISAQYPGFPQSLAPGWQFLLDTTKLSNGRHELEVVVRDVTGAETFIGRRTFIVANPQP
jgi:hypothetical protein